MCAYLKHKVRRIIYKYEGGDMPEEYPIVTLVLIVVAIIAILAAIAVPNFLEAQTRR